MDYNQVTYFVGRAWTYFKSRDLQAALYYQRRSLEEISITHSFYEFCEDFGSPEDKMEPVTFSDFACLKVLEISLPFVFGQEALQFAEGGCPHRIQGSPDPTEKDLKSMSRRLIDMVPMSIERMRFAQLSDIWAVRYLNTALLEMLRWHREKFTKLNCVELHFYPEKTTICLPDLRDSLAKALELGIEVKAFKGGRLGQDDVEEGWRMRWGRNREMDEAVQIPPC